MESDCSTKEEHDFLDDPISPWIASSHLIRSLEDSGKLLHKNMKILEREGELLQDRLGEMEKKSKIFGERLKAWDLCNQSLIELLDRLEWSGQSSMES